MPILRFGLILSCLLGSSYAQPTGSIAGTLSTGDGKPAIGKVRLIKISPAPMIEFKAQSNPGGAFYQERLPIGTYELCATVSTGDYLDPCVWNSTRRTVILSPGQNLSGIVVTVNAGAVFKVHLVDTGQLVKNTREGAVMMGVFAARGFSPLIKKNADSNGKSYEVTVPYDQDVYFFIKPVGIGVVDSNNATTENGQSIKLRFAKNGPAPSVMNFRVTDKK